MITNIFLVYLLRERRLLRDEASLSAYSAARRSYDLGVGDLSREWRRPQASRSPRSSYVGSPGGTSPGGGWKDSAAGGGKLHWDSCVGS